MQNIFFPESQLTSITRVDGTIAFYSQVNCLTNKNSVVIDFGCGRGAFNEDNCEFRKSLRNFKNRTASVIGLDVDRACLTNQSVDSAKILETNVWPIANDFADVIIADYVLEHLKDPSLFFLEAVRVLKPGGYLCFRTPNKWSYFGILSRLIPGKIHNKVLSHAQNDRKEVDIFPKFYRANSFHSLKKLLHKCGLSEAVVYGHEAEPSYFEFSRFLYRLAVYHQRFAPNCIKLVIFGFARKQIQTDTNAN